MAGPAQARAAAGGAALATAALLLVGAAAEPAPDWESHGNEDGIAVWTHPDPTSGFDAFRGVARVDAGLRALVDLLTDVEDQIHWYPDTREARVLESEGLRRGLIYNVTNAPWPVRDRDAVVRWELEQAEDLSVTVRLRGEPDAAPQRGGYVRVPRIEGHWRLAPLGPHRTEVTYELRMDPGGGIPAWLARRWVQSLPRDTLSALRERLRARPVLGSAGRFAVIREPEHDASQGGAR